MSISGRPRLRSGPPKKRTTAKIAKIRRDRNTAYTENWAAISAEVKRRAGHKCQKCGASGVPLEANHVIPVARGGVTAFFNLIALCRNCHDKMPGHGHLFKKRTLGRKTPGRLK